eukprot:scaffold22095_cov153-Skeletonema_dohrnii-CCMP3373.AAC.3
MDLSHLADDVLRHINNREALIQRLETLHREASHSRGNRVQRLLYGIHNASLAVVEAIEAWNASKQEDWYRRRNLARHIESHAHESSNGDTCPYNAFIWNEESYLKKMIYDLDFVRDIPEAITLFGSESIFHRNPFLLPYCIDEFVGEADHSSTTPWKDVNLLRICNASFLILLDEFHYKKSTTGIAPMTAAKFLPPNINAQELSALHGMSYPPAATVVALCCAHLILNTVEADVMNKLVFLTKAIMLRIFRHPPVDLVENAHSFNPLRRVDRSLIKIVAPFVMHDTLKPEVQNNVPEAIIHLLTWLRVLVSRSIDQYDIGNASKAANKVIIELESDNQRHGSQYKGCVFSTKETCTPHDDENKENARVNVSVQTDVFPDENDTHAADSSAVFEASAMNAVVNLLDGRRSPIVQQVPLPIEVTVDITEGSRIVVVNGVEKCAAKLQRGDTIRIYDAHESSDWKLSNDPTVSDETISFCLTEVYDHSRIIAQQKRSRANTLNRLCYPYKKDIVGEAGDKAPGVISTASEDAVRHVASDMNQSTHSPLHIRQARIWKLIHSDEDTRPQWRREYDNGDIPWVDEYAGRNKCDRHFRVSVPLEVTEQDCRDWPYLLDDDQYIHRQRVHYFEHVPLSDVIDEAFHAVCRWHPKGTLVDNVKWAKLSRKMQFLSNVKNAQHEIDMAFVRHNRDRKLDQRLFHAIFEDIASIQHPSMPTRDALTKVVWSSIVMLPDVNAMMWRESKDMAIHEEARRVCAQIRIAAFVRKILQCVKFKDTKHSAITIAKHVRRFLSRLFVAKILNALKDDEEYQQRVKCATVLQQEWRRFFWRNRFLCHQERVRAERRKHILITHAKLKEERERKLASVVYRDVIRIDETLAVVTIYLQDDAKLRDDASMLLAVYVPTTKRTFSFKLAEKDVRECLEKALSSEGKLSWDEMLSERALKELPKRLILRLVRNQPIFIFSRRHLVEKGILVDKRLVRADGEIFILSTFRSPHDFVFKTYQPCKCLHMRTKLTMSKLIEWIHDSKGDGDNQQNDSQVSILHPKRQPDLLEWLIKRVLIRKNPSDATMMILLQFEAEEERVLKLVIKVQSQWRRLRSFRHAKSETMHQYEKIFDRENQIYAYRNMLTDQRQKDKPKLLGEDELENPVDEWRKEETYDATTGQTIHYYANYATGQSSWLSEEEAARLVQRRYRSKHESDLIGKKITFADVVKAMQFINGARMKYEQDPTKLSNIVNYAILSHCLDLNFDAARSIYERAVKLSPNHPLISRVYAIFLLASRQAPHTTTFQTACQLLHDADVADRNQTMIKSAAEIYFRWAVLVDARNPLTLLNYALLHQCVYKNYDHAEKLYRAALALDQTNTLVVENYRLFSDERYPGGVYESCGPPFSVVQRSNVVEERLDWAEWRKMIDPLCPKKGFEVFWFNRFTKMTRFTEPDWELVWESRLKRSKWIDGKTTAQSEFYDERTKSSFFYNTYTQQYSSLPL